MGYDADRHRLILFGGRSAERRRLNDVHYLDLDTWTWHKPHVEGTPPSPRELASSVMWQGHLVVFGKRRVGAVELAAHITGLVVGELVVVAAVVGLLLVGGIE